MRRLCITLAIAAMACCQLTAFAQKKDAGKAAALQAEVMKKMMGKFDLNGDGNVDDDEKAQVVGDIKKQMDSGEIPDGFKDLLDRNRNGKLEKEEALAFREIVARLQAGGGGAPQFGAGPQFGPGNGGGPGLPGFGGPGAGGDAFSGQVPPDILKKFDKNKNGQLDDAEKKAAMAAMGPKKSRKEQLQEKLDLNGDGKITKEEREQVAAQRKAEQEEKKAEAEEKKASRSKKKADDKEKDEDKEDKSERADKDEK